ncbi:hypothetical protein Ciccas_012031 [Cichlidogyrus casuarinus]|uniref:Uncharacterized protein n=1 Tax=Cichlidogyrus casuarinus TaxID=1844966 RepID=A0ABD2PQX5_9PLAT
MNAAQNKSKLFDVSPSYRFTCYPLQWCIKGKLDELKNFREENVQDRDIYLEPDSDCVYCAHKAAEFSSLDNLKRLVNDYGLDVTVTDRNKLKPLHYAVMRKDQQGLVYILEKYPFSNDRKMWKIPISYSIPQLNI